MAGRRSSLVMIQKRLGAAIGARRATVCWIMVCVAVEREQLLGAAFAAQRPEARASAASQNYGIEVRVRFHVLESLTFTRRRRKLATCLAGTHEPVVTGVWYRATPLSHELTISSHAAWLARARCRGYAGFQELDCPLWTYRETPAQPPESQPRRLWPTSPDRGPAPRQLRSLPPRPESAPKFCPSRSLGSAVENSCGSFNSNKSTVK